MRNKRNQNRRNSPHRINIQSADGHMVLGRLVNITIGGLMFLADDPLPVGVPLSLRLPLPTIANGKDAIEVRGTIVWCRPDTNPEFHRIGFQFENLGAEEGYIVETVLQRLHLVG